MLMGVILLILAGPQVQRIPREERVLTNIQICMDVSGSMTVDNAIRWRRKRSKTSSFLEAATPSDSHSLEPSRFVGRHSPKISQPFDCALPFADPRHQPPFMGGTMIGAALRFCRDNMVAEASEGDRLLLLVSDGMSSDVNGGNAAELADEMKVANITVYHVHVGTDPVPSEVMEIANSTGGEAFVATDENGLRRIFKHIDRMKPARFKPATAIPMDSFQPFAMVGLLLVGLYGLGAFGRGTRHGRKWDWQYWRLSGPLQSLLVLLSGFTIERSIVLPI